MADNLFDSLASLVTHMSATAWGGFQIQSTSNFRNDFQRLSTNGACKINLLPQYWQARGDAEIPSLALNAAVLLVTAVLSWRLIKVRLYFSSGTAHNVVPINR